MISSDEIRQMFLEFFNNKGHQIVESSSLIPQDDPTLLFTNSGMNQFKDVFLGRDSRSYNRAVTAQRCIRAGGKHNDLENVGYTDRHHTFFEMLGNFSFGDYFKKDAIQFAWELLTSKKWFNLSKDKIWVTVHISDQETYNIWCNQIKISEKHIIRVGNNQNICASDNFWQMSDIGPCGLCSEIYYDRNKYVSRELSKSEIFGDNFIEIWNLVFIQFDRQKEGDLFPLSKPSVDTGMGLERITAVLQNVDSNYDTDLFKKLIIITAEMIGVNDLNNKSLRVISDHIRSCVFLIGDGITPSNEGRGYVLRRIIRRAVRHGNVLGVHDVFFYKLVSPFIKIMESITRRLELKQDIIEQIIREEEVKFLHTLQQGLFLLNKELKKVNGNTLDGKVAFRLHDTFGFPVDLTVDICRERNLHFDYEGYKRELEKQKKRSHNPYLNLSIERNKCIYVNQTTQFLGYEFLESRSKIVSLFHNKHQVNVIRNNEEGLIVLDKTPFYGESGGQIGDQGEIRSNNGGIFKVLNTRYYDNSLIHIGSVVCGEIKLGEDIIARVDKKIRKNICLNHSATHLLYASLRQIFDNTIYQKGSFMNNEYLRFDFSFDKPIKAKQIRKIENIVNEKIRCNLPIRIDNVMSKDVQDKKFLSKINNEGKDKLRILNIGDFSVEFCRGTHVNRTGDIGLFHITSVRNISSGIKRIEAITGERALQFFYQQSDLLDKLSALTKCSKELLADKIKILQEQSIQWKKNITDLKIIKFFQENKLIYNHVRNVNGIKVLVDKIKNFESNMLHIIVKRLKENFGSSVIVFALVEKSKVILIAGVTEDLINRITANDIIDYFLHKTGGKGGGTAILAQARGEDVGVGVLGSILINLNKMILEKL